MTVCIIYVEKTLAMNQILLVFLADMFLLGKRCYENLKIWVNKNRLHKK